MGGCRFGFISRSMDEAYRNELRTMVKGDREMTGSPTCTVCRVQKTDLDLFDLHVKLNHEFAEAKNPRLIVFSMEDEPVDEVLLEGVDNKPWGPGADFVLSSMEWQPHWPEGGMSEVKFYLVMDNEYGEPQFNGPLEHE